MYEKPKLCASGHSFGFCIEGKDVGPPMEIKFHELPTNCQVAETKVCAKTCLVGHPPAP
ncbi:hypothetical protein P3T20_004607 [Paraburkholderia sp. GAS206C]|uniref:Uncharacterized protein n=1 Tax=Paraburkholderia phenazinium TaxID=60549 RepID=A0A1N6K4B2_9BURK|nr:hypothetical protein SAMN05444168_5934 [Paraburkholderia phenazinium]